ncbi:MAG: hypothetical protein M1834_003166 [Cirrosporium novae-zelandiae]|nr:MAG: hypothetical protein M1834_003166 [Cirrosporium novae-zelandiae]
MATGTVQRSLFSSLSSSNDLPEIICDVHSIQLDDAQPPSAHETANTSSMEDESEYTEFDVIDTEDGLDRYYEPMNLGGDALVYNFDDSLDLLSDIDFDFDLEIASGFISSKYEFRQKPKEQALILRGCLDQDRSGNYDPQNPIEPTAWDYTLKRKRTTNADQDFKNKNKRGEGREGGPKRYKIGTTWLTGRQHGKQKVVIFKLTSLLGKALLQSLKSSDSHVPLTPPTTSDPSLFGASSSAQQSYNFRTFGDPMSRNLSARQSSILNPKLPFGLDQIGPGHPEARGCVQCYEAGQDCPLLDDGESYPCRICVEDKCDCQPIIPPEKKRACECCKRKHIVCSYRQDLDNDHDKPCKQCQVAGIMCIAGPQTARCRSWRPVRSPVNKQRGTSYRKPTKSLLRNINKSKNSQPSPRNPEPICRTTRVIQTRFAHPITFHHIDETLNTPCHFCADFLYGIFGLGLVRVEVIKFASHEGYTEIDGGHTGRGAQPTRMCVYCTQERLNVCFCPQHEIVPIQGIAEDTSKKAFEELTSTQPKALEEASDYCSICPAPATHFCKTQPVDMLAELSMAQNGCGLFLCEDCAVSLVEEFQGDLDTMIKGSENRIDGDESPFPLGLRADVQFLVKDGELVERCGIEGLMNGVRF